LDKEKVIKQVKLVEQSTNDPYLVQVLESSHHDLDHV
jgi:hypothetical protein